MSSGRNGQVSRIYMILNLLENSSHGLTVSQITSKVNDRGFEAKSRTVYRDLEALSSAGFPLMEHKDKSEEGNATIWMLERTARINEYLVLTPREIFGLYMAKQVLSPLRDTPFYRDLENLFSKIEDKLGKKNKEYLGEISEEIHFDPGPAWGLGVMPDVIDGVRSACAEGHYLSCEYSSANSGTTIRRKLGPHYIYFSKGALYLVAEDGDAVKTFSLSRMKNVVMLEEEYKGEKTDPEKYFAGSIGVFKGSSSPEEVKLSFSPQIAPFAKEREWHRSQSVVNRPNGVVEMTLHVSITPELVSWVLGFGPGATVLSPKSLQSQVIEAAQKVLQNYNPPVKKAG